MTTDTTSLYGDIIYSYTREQAINDGVLIPVNDQICREAGIRLPVCVTDHLWTLIHPDNLNKMPSQSVEGRLWDLLWLFTVSAKQNGGSSRLKYPCRFMIKRDGCPEKIEEYTIVAVCGPGDSGEPVLTLMLLEDD